MAHKDKKQSYAEYMKEYKANYDRKTKKEADTPWSKLRKGIARKLKSTMGNGK